MSLGLGAAVAGASQGLQDLRQRKQVDEDREMYREDRARRQAAEDAASERATVEFAQGQQDRRADVDQRNADSAWQGRLRDNQSQIWDYEGDLRETEAERKAASAKLPMVLSSIRENGDMTMLSNWYNEHVGDGLNVTIEQREDGYYAVPVGLGAPRGEQFLGKTANEVEDLAVGLMNPETYAFNRMERRQSMEDLEKKNAMDQANRLTSQGGLQIGADGNQYLVDAAAGTAKGITGPDGGPFRPRDRSSSPSGFEREVGMLRQMLPEASNEEIIAIANTAKSKPRPELIIQMANLMEKNIERDRRGNPVDPSAQANLMQRASTAVDQLLGAPAGGADDGRSDQDIYSEYGL